MICWHLTISSVGRATLFPTEASRRAAVRALARVVGAHTVAFCVVDDHLHLVLLCAAAQVRSLARDLQFALRALTGAAMHPGHIIPLESRAHLDYVVREYVLVQPRKHDLAGPPALWTGSCFLDLAGARVLPGLTLQIGAVLPRYRTRTAFEVVGLAPAPLAPLGPEALRAAGAARIVSAAAAALAVGPALAGRTSGVVEARRVAAQLANLAGVPSGELAHALRVHVGSVGRLASGAASPAAVRATRLRLALEDAAGAAG